MIYNMLSKHVQLCLTHAEYGAFLTALLCIRTALLSIEKALFSSQNPNNALLSQCPVCTCPEMCQLFGQCIYYSHSCVCYSHSCMYYSYRLVFFPLMTVLNDLSEKLYLLLEKCIYFVGTALFLY